MEHRLVAASVLCLVPLAALVLGGQLLFALSGSRPRRAGLKPLYLRLAGYDVDEVAKYWKRLAAGAGGLDHERRFLRLDLAFPLVYGGALLASLLLLGRRVGWPASWAVPFALVAITALADWTENVIQLGQLKRFVAHGASGLEAGWIRAASVVTRVKLVGTVACFVLVFLLAWFYVAQR